MLSRGVTGDEQAGQVHARNQQQQADRDHQQSQWGAELLSQIGDASRCRGDRRVLEISRSKSLRGLAGRDEANEHRIDLMLCLAYRDIRLQPCNQGCGRPEVRIPELRRVEWHRDVSGPADEDAAERRWCHTDYRVRLLIDGDGGADDVR